MFLKRSVSKASNGAVHSSIDTFLGVVHAGALFGGLVDSRLRRGYLIVRRIPTITADIHAVAVEVQA